MTSEVEKTAATPRIKTGGRKAGTPNKPKAAHSGAPPNPTYLPVAGAREAEADLLPSTSSPFPRYKLAKVDTLVPYANNARTHTPAQIAKITASIREFGFTNPVLTDGKRGIVAGHGRVLAAQALGMDVVPSIELSHLTAAQRRAYVLADNRLALDAGWDDELLTLELGELKDLGFDLALTGFDGVELEGLFSARGDGQTEPDEPKATTRCPTCGAFRPDGAFAEIEAERASTREPVNDGAVTNRQSQAALPSQRKRRAA